MRTTLPRGEGWRRLLRVAAAAFALAATSMASADDFPSRPIKIMVGFGPGGLGDIVVRVVAQKMSDSMGRTVYIENAPGAGGITAAAQVAKAPPDGYTLLLVSGQNAFSPYLFKSLPYDPVESFSMISTLGTFYFLLVADKDSPMKSVADVVAAAGKNAASFNIGTINAGSAQNLTAQLFATSARLTVPIVPFKSTGDVITSLHSGDVQAGFETVTGVIGQVRQGGIKAIATSSPQRLPFLPGVPTIAESGVAGLDKFESDSWNGIVAPAGTPPAVVARLNAEIAKALALPDVQRKFIELGVQPGASTPEALKRVFMADAAKWRVVIERAGLDKQ